MHRIKLEPGRMGAIIWMRQGPFGLMVHYLSHVHPREGDIAAEWDDAVGAFDVPCFVEDIVSTRAKWLILPFGQNTGRYIAPNAYLEQRLPGACTRRDLFGDIAGALADRGVRTIAYLPSEIDSAPAAQREALGWDLHPRDKSVFQDHWMSVIREWSLCYGELISGWWFDGCYDAVKSTHLRTREWDNSRFDETAWKAAVRAGNPRSVLAMNCGALPGERRQLVFSDQDFHAGEANELDPPPEIMWEDYAQWHALVWIDCCWMHDRPGPMPPPRFSDEELFSFVQTCHARGGGVTLNIGIHRDGTLADKSVDQLRRLGAVMA